MLGAHERERLVGGERSVLDEVTAERQVGERVGIVDAREGEHEGGGDGHRGDDPAKPGAHAPKRRRDEARHRGTIRVSNWRVTTCVIV